MKNTQITYCTQNISTCSFQQLIPFKSFNIKLFLTFNCILFYIVISVTISFIIQLSPFFITRGGQNPLRGCITLYVCVLRLLRFIKHKRTTYAKATLILTNKVRKRLLVATAKRFVLSLI